MRKMRNSLKIAITLLAALAGVPGAIAGNGEVRERTVIVRYGQGKCDLDTTEAGNGRELLQLLRDMKDSTTAVTSVDIFSSASPEGSLKRNKYLTDMRAGKIAEIIRQELGVPDSLLTVRSVVENWDGLMGLVKASEMSHKEEVIRILDDESISDDVRESRIMSAYGGSPYSWMSVHLFPQLRYTEMNVRLSVIPGPAALSEIDTMSVDSIPEMDTIPAIDSVQVDPPATEQHVERKRLNLLLKTNAVSDLLAAPNLGAELHLGRRWSAGANLTYGWWTDRDRFYWRTFATDVNVRKYFGGKGTAHPLQGHHLGIFAGIVTYDYELGNRGFISDYKDSWSYYSGLDYGYSLPLTRHLNIDFTLGLGYMGGRYKEYVPVWDEGSKSMHYVWQSTKDRNYWGPTRLEVSLVWLIGKNN